VGAGFVEAIEQFLERSFAVAAGDDAGGGVDLGEDGVVLLEDESNVREKDFLVDVEEVGDDVFRRLAAIERGFDDLGRQGEEERAQRRRGGGEGGFDDWAQIVRFHRRTPYGWRTNGERSAVMVAVRKEPPCHDYRT